MDKQRGFKSGIIIFTPEWKSERRKLLAHHGMSAEDFFWRITQQQKVDYVEENQAGFSYLGIQLECQSNGPFPEDLRRSLSAMQTHHSDFWQFRVIPPAARGWLIRILTPHFLSQPSVSISSSTSRLLLLTIESKKEILVMVFEN